MSQAFTLLNPGPINVSARVRRALTESPDQCHREPEYLAMQGRVRDKLVRAFDVAADYDAVLLTGSGTAAMEAMVSSVVGEGVLVVDNGVYGDRLLQMAAAHGVAHDRVRCSWFERPDLGEVLGALGDRHDTLAVVHHETTTGLLNDLEGLARLAEREGRRLIVDSVSGLAGERLDFGAVRPAAVCCTANKCIQGLPGVAFVLVRKGTPLVRRSVYLDLGALLEKQARGDTPFTPAIQVTAAFEAAVDELIDETVEARIGRYARASTRIRATLERLGLDLLLPPALRSNTITSVALPRGKTYEDVHDHMRAHGFVIYAGQGDLKRRVWRIANMGAIADSDLDRLDDALGSLAA